VAHGLLIFKLCTSLNISSSWNLIGLIYEILNVVKIVLDTVIPLAYFLFVFTSPLSFPITIVLLCFQAGCHRKQLNLGYNLSRFICCIFVFDDLYFVDLVSLGLLLC